MERDRDPGPGTTMGRTTLRIDDELLRRLRRRAADEDRTLQDVTNEALRRGLVERPAPRDYRLELEGWEARTRSGVELTDRGSLLDTMEDRAQVRALDTNVLVYAEVRGTDHHDTALGVLREHAEGSRPWALTWPCLYEFLRVVTHPEIFDPPVPIQRALADLERILDSPSLHLLSESPRHRILMAELVAETGVSGNLVHDAHIAALCLEHGVRELVTGDRGFRRFPGLEVVDPFGE